MLPDSVAAELRSVCADIGRGLDRFVSLTDQIQGALARVQRPASVMSAPPKAAHRPQIARPAPEAPAADGERKLSKAERSILTVLAQYSEPMSLQRIAILAGYTAGTGGFNNALGALRSSGYILRGDPAQITDAGLSALGDFEPLPQGDDLRAYWLGRLGKAERALLAVLLDIHPNTIAPDELATRAGYTPKTGGFNNALGRLRTMQLAEGYGEVKAADAFFEYAR